MKRLILAALALACLTVMAEARPRAVVAHERCNIDWPCEGVSASPRGMEIEKAMPFGRAQQVYAPRNEAGGAFVRGRLICAINVNAELARRGIAGTASAMARSFLSWGSASGPQPGAVAVFSRGQRGGHVAIVDHVDASGNVIYLNPSSRRQSWQVGPYHRRPIAFRVAG